MTGELKDVLAGRTEDEEAMCAVCSGGLSVAPNLIVFCERCDIAVHQRCYGVDDIPAGLLTLCTFCNCGPGIASVCIGGWQWAYSVKIHRLYKQQSTGRCCLFIAPLRSVHALRLNCFAWQKAFAGGRVYRHTTNG